MSATSPTSVYVLETGEFAEVCVAGVFTTVEKAQDYFGEPPAAWVHDMTINGGRWTNRAGVLATITEMRLDP